MNYPSGIGFNKNMTFNKREESSWLTP